MINPKMISRSPEDDGPIFLAPSLRESIWRKRQQYMENVDHEDIQETIFRRIHNSIHNRDQPSSKSSFNVELSMEPTPPSRLPPICQRSQCRVQAPGVFAEQASSPLVEELKFPALCTSVPAKTSRFQRLAKASHKPVIKRAAAKSADGSQGRGEALEIPALTSEQPLDSPELALAKAFRLLQDEKWERKIEGLRLVRALADHHAEVLLPELPDVCFAVIKEVENLLSKVAYAAMTTLAHMYAHLQRKMDKMVEFTVCALLHKAGEPSHFVKEGVEVALSSMVQNSSPRRVLHALLKCGFSHKTTAVRRCTALHLEKLANVLGASRVLSAKKKFTSQFLTAISKLALDSAQEVRLHAQNTLRMLGSHEDCAKVVDKFVPLSERRSVLDIITKTI